MSVATPHDRPLCRAHSNSFNPWRVFLSVATAIPIRSSGAAKCFNPWRVFLSVATLLDSHHWRIYRHVSIPGGFSCPLRLKQLAFSSREGITFQSLAGFLVRCDPRGPLLRLWHNRVSIPGGFSCPLRPSLVFIGTNLFFLFQSLAGFLVRCDGGPILGLLP